MDKQEVLLAVMTCAGRRDAFSPVQIQKTLFILDREIPDGIGGPIFDFQPWDYGPSDRTVYAEIDRLIEQGYIQVGDSGRPYRVFLLTQKGYEKGVLLFAELSDKVRDYAARVVEFVLSQSFSNLVSTIYRTYPDMAVNSVFRE